ncbi:MAG: DUF3858 domain-containing protein, partial [Myxococcales bacterium]|nr:DUF3858 domain-containing protein [Myxococcales bacterium]
YELDVVLAGDGSAKVDHVMDLTGAGASSWRGGLEAKEQRKELLTKMLSRTFPGTVVRTASFPGIEDILAPVRVEAALEVPAYTTVEQGGKLRWRVVGHEVQLLRSYAAQQKREYPLEIGVPNREERSIRYTLPAGMRFAQVPSGATVESPFGRLVLTIKQDGRTATVETLIEFTRDRIEPAEYGEFREFLTAIDAALAQTFEGTR